MVIDWHPTHLPDEPKDIGFGTGLIYCKACHALLRSDRGSATNRRVNAPCEPTQVTLRTR